MTSDTTQEAQYELVLQGESCDICESAAGPYSERPQVPLHKNCDCIAKGPAQRTPNCTIEVRNLQTQYSEWTVAIDVEINKCTDPPEVTGDEQAESLTRITSSFDEGVREAAEAAGWTEPPTLQVQDIPLDNHHNIFELEFTIGTWMFIGDQWEICTVKQPDGTTKKVETLLGKAGGGWSGPVSGQNTHKARPCPGPPVSDATPPPDGMPEDDSVDLV